MCIYEKTIQKLSEYKSFSADQKLSKLRSQIVQKYNEYKKKSIKIMRKPNNAEWNMYKCSFVVICSKIKKQKDCKMLWPKITLNFGPKLLEKCDVL